MERRLGPAFYRCYDLDERDGPSPRPAALSPVGLAVVGFVAVLCFLVLMVTPFWHATEARNPNPTANAADPVAAGSAR